jgi:hypothetical protein
VIGAEGFAASITVELIAAGAEHLAAGRIGAGVDFQDGVSSILVAFHREAFKEGVAGGAGCGGKSRFHTFHYMLNPLSIARYLLRYSTKGVKLVTAWQNGRD